MSRPRRRRFCLRCGRRLTWQTRVLDGFCAQHGAEVMAELAQDLDEALRREPVAVPAPDNPDVVYSLRPISVELVRALMEGLWRGPGAEVPPIQVEEPRLPAPSPQEPPPPRNHPVVWINGEEVSVRQFRCEYHAGSPCRVEISDDPSPDTTRWFTVPDGFPGPDAAGLTGVSLEIRNQGDADLEAGEAGLRCCGQTFARFRDYLQHHKDEHPDGRKPEHV